MKFIRIDGYPPEPYFHDVMPREEHGTIAVDDETAETLRQLKEASEEYQRLLARILKGGK